MSTAVESVIVEALRIVTDSRVPDDLRVAAFSKTVDLLATGSVAPLSRASIGANEPAQSDAHGPIEAIAKRIGLPADIAADVYENRDGDIVVVAPPRAFDKAKMAATKQLALLVAAGRQGAGLEDATGVDAIRRAAEDFGFLDVNNFARTLSEMDQDFIITGTPRARTFKLRRPAWDKAKDLIAQLSGYAS